MKKVAKFIFLFAVMGLLFVNPLESRAAYTPTNDAYTLVNYLNGQVGNSYTANRCQAFVYNSLVNSLGVYGAKACAYEAWLGFGVSTDRDIPLGAAVYFSGGSYPCGDHIAGHVGLYVGDGYVVHVAQSMVQKTLVSSIESWSGYSYLGWGWQGGYALATYVPDYTEAPTNVSLSVNKSLYAAGETVTFTCAGTNVSGYTIGIERDGSRIFTGDINGVYETSFSEPGNYAAYVTAWNSIGTTDSQWITFSVYNTTPTNVSISTYKDSFSVGETITFTYTGTNVNGYAIGIDRDGTRVFTGDISAVYETSFTDAGSYSAYITAWNSLGSVDSARIYFTVYAGAPYNPWIVADKTVVNVGEEISFTFNASDAASFVLGIDKVGTGRVSSPSVGESTYYTTSFSEAGTYSVYATCYNSFGGCDSAPITFIVYNTVPAYSELVADKSIVNVGEEITFTCNSDTARRFAIGIDRNGERCFSSFITTGFKKSFSEPGEYAAYVTAENEYGSVDSLWICFVIYNSVPTYSELTCDNSIVKVGEEITFTCSSDTARGFAIGIDKNGERYFSSDITTGFKKSFSEPGVYTAYVTAANEYGSIDSPCISFKVYSSKPSYCNLEINKRLLSAGEEITFCCSSDYAERFDISISKDGSHLFSTSIPPQYNKSFSDPGTYTAYVTALNDYGSIDSSVITFYVVDPDETLATNSIVTKVNGTIQVSTELTGQYENAILFAASYRGAALTALEMCRLVETEREKVFYLLPETDSDTVKVYLWKTDSLRPICDAEIIPKSEWVEAEQ